MCRSNGQGPPFTPSGKPTWFPSKGLAGSTRRNGGGRRFSTTERDSDVCIYPSEGGGPRSKGGTLKHYRGQQRKGGLWCSVRDCEGVRALTRRGPVAWFRWVFLELEQHEEDCRWRRFVTRGAR